jgi:hypothetical protein
VHDHLHKDAQDDDKHEGHGKDGRPGHEAVFSSAILRYAV